MTNWLTDFTLVRTKIWGNLVLERIPQLDVILITGFWLVASYLYIVSYSHVPMWSKVANYAVHVVCDTLFAWVFINILVPSFLPKRQFIKLFLSMLLFLSFTSALTLWAWQYADPEPYPVSWRSFIDTIGIRAENGAILTMILAMGRIHINQQRTLKLEAERKTAELQLLRKQVDPHFLFNSLNVLDVLIEQDTKRARQFLKNLSNMYRYLLRNQNEDLVSLEEELEYSKAYLEMVETRFGDAFILPKLDDLNIDAQEFFVPPGSVQTILENAYKHNIGSVDNPVKIQAIIDGNDLRITNTYHPVQTNPSANTGTGILNLKRRYQLLTNQPLSYGLKNGLWEVRLPLILPQ